MEADLTELKKVNLDDMEILTKEMNSICVDEKSLFVCASVVLVSRSLSKSLITGIRTWAALILSLW